MKPLSGHRTTRRSPPLSQPAGLLSAALRDRFADQRKAFRRCRHRPDEPAVHHFRTETRRLLAMLDLAAALVGAAAVGPARRAAKRQLRAVGTLRDTQVHLLQVGKLVRNHSALAAFQRELQRRERQLRRKATLKLRGRRLDRKVRLIRERLAALSDQAADPAGLLDSLQRQHTQKLARIRVLHRAHGGNPEQEHALRIAVKQARYLAEALAVFQPRVPARLIARLRRCQQATGEARDISLLGRALRTHTGKTRHAHHLVACAAELEQLQSRLLGRARQEEERIARVASRAAPRPRS